MADIINDHTTMPTPCPKNCGGVISLSLDGRIRCPKCGAGEVVIVPVALMALLRKARREQWDSTHPMWEEIDKHLDNIRLPPVPGFVANPGVCEAGDCGEEEPVPHRVKCPACGHLVCAWCWGHIHGAVSIDNKDVSPAAFAAVEDEWEAAERSIPVPVATPALTETKRRDIMPEPKNDAERGENLRLAYNKLIDAASILDDDPNPSDERIAAALLNASFATKILSDYSNPDTVNEAVLGVVTKLVSSTEHTCGKNKPAG